MLIVLLSLVDKNEHANGRKNIPINKIMAEKVYIGAVCTGACMSWQIMCRAVFDVQEREKSDVRSVDSS